MTRAPLRHLTRPLLAFALCGLCHSVKAGQEEPAQTALREKFRNPKTGEVIVWTKKEAPSKEELELISLERRAKHSEMIAQIERETEAQIRKEAPAGYWFQSRPLTASMLDAVAFKRGWLRGLAGIVVSVCSAVLIGTVLLAGLDVLRNKPKRTAVAQFSLRFAVVYSLYLGLVLPFVSRSRFETVGYLGVPFALAVLYLSLVAIRRRR